VVVSATSSEGFRFVFMDKLLDDSTQKKDLFAT